PVPAGAACSLSMGWPKNASPPMALQRLPIGELGFTVPNIGWTTGSTGEIGDAMGFGMEWTVPQCVPAHRILQLLYVTEALALSCCGERANATDKRALSSLAGT